MLFASLIYLLVSLVCFWISMVSGDITIGGFFQLVGWILLSGFIMIFLIAAPQSEV